MRIVYLTYAPVTGYSDPEALLRRLDFYTAQLEAMVPVAEVKSIHLMNYEGVLLKNNVEYHFKKPKKWDWLFPFSIHRYVTELRPDVVMIHSLRSAWQVLWLSMRLGKNVKLCAIHHAEKPLRFPKSIFQKLADRVIHAYFFSSLELGKEWIDSHLINSQSKIHEVIEVSSFFYPTKQPLDLSTKCNTYLWVGRLDDNKDPVTLIKAFTKFINDEPEATLKIVYRGGNLKESIDMLLSANKSIKERIILTEDVPHDALLHWYNGAAFVISTSHYESSGAAVCEGMACGCIPIISNIPSFRMMTQHGAIGLFFEAGNVTDLYNALIKSRKLRIADERQKVLKQFKENLSCESVSRKMMDVINTR